MTKFKRPHFHKSKIPHKQAVGAKTRAAAAQIVHAVGQGHSLNTAFAQFCSQLDGRDNAFVKEIVYGTLRHRRLLMATLKPMFDYKITVRHSIVQALLITAFYQLVFMRTPAHAVVASTVSACADCGHKSFTALVNAILRRFLREGGRLVHTPDMAVECSFPDWLFEKIKNSYPDNYLDILRYSNEKAPLFIRVENSKISTADYLKLLEAKEMEATTFESLAPCAVKLNTPVNVDEIPGFTDGLSTVQDLSAQMAALLLDLETAENQGESLRILDCCCAPGGKTAHILDIVPKAQVIALDVDELRLKQTKSTLDRLNRTATLQVLDAQDLSSIEGQFDRILVDAPCSGTGVIRRHPDIKWLRRAKDIEALSQMQANILDQAFAKLKTNGILVYTTCSILPDENIKQVNSFLERHKDAKLVPFKQGEQEYTTKQRLPGEDQADGFFYARFTKA